jgi:hypothetical protein
MENEAFRTERVNRVFLLIPQLNRLSGGDKQKQDGINTVLSNWVGQTGQMSNLLIQDLKALGDFISLNTL